MGSVDYPIDTRAVDESRPIKVVCIGAGISGILTAIRFPQRIKNLQLVVYEKNEGPGGTWFENKERISNIPSHAYQYTFENNPNWSRFYAPGSEILDYLNHVIDKYGARKHMKFKHEFKGARWSKKDGKWDVELLRHTDGKIMHDTADVVIKATCTLNKWKWPDIPGLNSFKGTLLHSANWDKSFDATGKTLAVIGNGSTGIQIVPALQPKAKKITSYIRSKAWVSPTGPYTKLVADHGGDENFLHSKEEKAALAQDPSTLLGFRKEIEEVLHRSYLGIFSNSKAQADASAKLEALVREKMGAKPGLFELLKPEWPVGCKRLGASPGYLESIIQENVDIVTYGIERVTPTGILDNSGVERPVDAIICATGFDTSLRNSTTPFIGHGRISLDEVWTPEPEAYLSIMPVKMPNLFLYLGPNGAPNSTMIVMIEFQCEYMIKCVQKLQREHLKWMVPKVEAKDDFVKYADKFFDKTVLTESCASWFKSGGRSDGRITAMWPGSLVHAWKIYENPRWEDFEYGAMPATEDNRLAWFGNGLTLSQVHGTSATAYLDHVDTPPVDSDWLQSKGKGVI
ncbi:FAD/NAD(P)-binding domain-containing protein [Aaosphaeria arxii CBS 175.79]|uniref:FAD/NAD(P)-binding domain-containing protein n=1 Tax=Aaosphaeria arxii CBS 175.79 TaxID=1450172 RepID=A0A6A5XPT9_9PLEO|nr:FAD/NAD(P)-binding domain-containing protein [Aaosphaeria arxii CBS 175.79]KAF2015162.1 FAD/NAD(P)-binding domain-containing protein [Aaosphaeria arxii CBS 175.79]